MTWFDDLMGFPELSAKHVQDNITVSGNRLISKVNGKEWIHGSLEIQSLGELRDAVAKCGLASGKLSVREIIADVKALHTDISNQSSLFQVASQFNLLEMVSPTYSPEQGVGIYQNDFTQGPACAISGGAGTIYRNYFAPVGDQKGQSLENQIDCIADLGTALANPGYVEELPAYGFTSLLFRLAGGVLFACPTSLDALRPAGARDGL
jgi:hypothetical protein